MPSDQSLAELIAKLEVTKTTPIPFLKFPDIPMEMIIRGLSLKDRFAVSITSQKLRRIVKNYKLNSVKIEVISTKPNHQLIVVNKGKVRKNNEKSGEKYGKYDEVGFHLHSLRLLDGVQLETNIVSGNSTFSISLNEDGYVNCCHDPTSVSLVDFINFINDIYNPEELAKLCFRPNDVFTMEGLPFEKATDLFISGEAPVKFEKIAKLALIISPGDTYFYVPLQGNCNESQINLGHCCTFNKKSRVTIEQLRCFASPIILLDGLSLDNRAVAQFLREWFEMTSHENIECLDIRNNSKVLDLGIIAQSLHRIPNNSQVPNGEWNRRPGIKIFSTMFLVVRKDGNTALFSKADNTCHFITNASLSYAQNPEKFKCTLEVGPE